MTDLNRPPLWRVMQEAGDEAAAAAVMNFDGFAIAAEIRALRDWLVPEEDPPATDDRLARDWTVRMRLRDLLTTEADRAEQSEVEHG